MLPGLVALALGLLAQVSSASAQDRWVLLASGEIELSSANTSIDLVGIQPIKQLRLVAKNGGITLSKVVVSNRDARAYTEERRINLLAGERTKPIDPREESGFADRLALFIDGGPKTGGVARLGWGLAIETTAPADAERNEIDSLNGQVAQLYQAGKFDEAIALAERALALVERFYGSADAEVSISLDRLGALYYGQSRWAEAEPLFKRSLAIREKALGPDHQDVGTTLVGLAEIYRQQGRNDDAEPLYKRGISIFERALGPDHIMVGTSLHVLAWLYASQGRYIEAEPLYTRSLSILENAMGIDHPEVGECLNNLAVLYRNQERYAEAEPLFQRSLAIREKTLGPDHPDVGASLNDLGLVYLDQRRYAEAEPLIKRALAIREKTLGPDHLDVSASLNDLALVYERLTRYAEAEPLYKRSLVIREKALGPDHLDVRQSLTNLADLYFNQSRLDEAEPLYERSLAIREKALGRDHLDVGQSLTSLANLYYDQRRYAEAEPLYKRSLEVREKALGSDHLDVGASLNDLGLVYLDQRRYAEAEPLIKRALAIREKALGPDHLDVSASLNDLALVYERLTRYAEAEPLYKRSLAIREKTLGPDHLDVRLLLTNLANLYYDQRQYAEAEPLYKRALAIREKALGPDHPDVGASLNDLGLVYLDQRRYAEAEPLIKRALAIREKALGPDHLDVSASLNDLANLYYNQSWLAEAEPLYKRSLAIREKALGPDHRDVSQSLTNLANLFTAQGRYAEAERLYKRSLAVREKALGPDHPDLVHSLINLANLYHDQSRYTEAEPLFKRSVAILETARGTDHPEVGSVAIHLADIYRHLGRYGEAEPILERWASILEKSSAAYDYDFMNSIDILADVHRNQDRYAAAEPLYKRSLAISKKLDPDSEGVGTSLNDLAWLYFEKRDWAQAASYWRQSADLVIQLSKRGTQNVGHGLTGKIRNETQRKSFRFTSLVKATHRMGEAQPERAHELAGQTFITAQWALNSEAAAALAQMSARVAKGGGVLARPVRERQDLVFEWRSKDKLLIAAHTEPPDRRNLGAETELSTRLRAIEARLDEIDASLKKDFSDYAALASPEPLSIEDVQAQLRDGEALILFLDTEELKPTLEETFVWVVTSTDSRWVKSDIGTKGLGERVTALRCGLDSSNWMDASWWFDATDDAKRRKDAQVARRERCKTLTGAEVIDSAPPPFDVAKANELYQALFRQVEDLLKTPDGTAKQLLVVPSGPLTQLPFQVLVTEKPDATKAADNTNAAWLIKRHAITVLPSVASLKALRQGGKSSNAAQAFVGFGNPLLVGLDGTDQRAFARQSCPKSDPKSEPIVVASRALPETFASLLRGGVADMAALRRQAPLPETADELCAVAHELGADDLEVNLGARATETRIKQLNADGALAQARVVHFATHGLIASETESIAESLAEPALLLTPPDAATATDDGLLTASEVTELKLNADWVVLSACNTAAGGEKGDAEALSGLARAFFYAGAHALLVSHWYVDSQAAVKITTGAFAELKRDPAIGRAEALRRAMLAAMVDTSRPAHWTPAAHPAVWAPFVVVGEGGAGW